MREKKKHLKEIKGEKIMKKILNTMAHALTDEQIIDLNNMFTQNNISNLRDVDNELFKQLSNITVDSDLNYLANCLLEVARKFDIVILPIGSPAFMFTFSRLTHFHRDIVFMFAHSDRISVEKQNEDGTVTKTNTFKHVKFLVM
jgi:hypothetical protein